MGRARIGFGTAPLAGLYDLVPDDIAHRTLEAAFAAGIRFFDTAPHYGLGLAEERLGTFIAATARSAVHISTKVGRVLEPAVPDEREAFAVRRPFRRRTDFSRDGILRSLEGSLGRLRVDRVDTLLLHDPEHEPVSSLRDGAPAIAELKADGTVDRIGVATNRVEQAERFVRELDLDVVMIAGRFTLLDRTAARLLDVCAQRGIDVAVAGVFNSGVLADPTEHSHFDYRPVTTEVLASAQRMQSACARYGLSLASVAVRFALRHPAVSTAVLGMRSPGEVASAVEAEQAVIPSELWTELDDIASAPASAIKT